MSTTSTTTATTSSAPATTLTLLQNAIGTLLSSTSAVSNLNVGSVARAILEAVSAEAASIDQENFDLVASAILQAGYEIWQVVPAGAVASQYLLTFSLSSSAPAAVTVPAGQLVGVPGTALQWGASLSVTVQPGGSASVIGVGTVPGRIGNVPAHTITQILNPPSPLLTVTNPSAQPTVLGADAETPTEAQAQLANAVNTVHTGDDGAIEVAALRAVVTNAAGAIAEQVLAAKAVDAPTAGEAALFLWNGSGAASSALLTAVTTEMVGYIDTAGIPHRGAKAAGQQLVLLNAGPIPVPVSAAILPASGYTFAAVQAATSSALTQFFAALDIEQGFSVAQIAEVCLGVPGVADVTVTAPSAALAAVPTVTPPSTAPTLAASTTSPATALAAGTYTVALTAANLWGETTASPTATVTLTAGQAITVTPADPVPTGATHYNVYLSVAAGSSTLGFDGTSPGTAVTLTALPLSGAAAPPSSNTALAHGTLYTAGTFTLTEAAS